MTTRTQKAEPVNTITIYARPYVNLLKLECGRMPNVMVAMPNVGGALCSTPQSLADADTWLPCSNAAKTRNPLKLAGVLQTPELISAVSGPKFTILWGRLEDILLLNKFFPIVDTCLSCEDIVRQICAMVPHGDFWRHFASCIFSEPHAAHFKPAS